MKFDLSKLSHGELMELVVTLSTAAGLTASRKKPPGGERALPFAPRGLSRTEAAAYIGVGATLFDEMVKDGRMPRPKAIKSRRVWDRFALDAHFDDLPEAEEADPFAFMGE